MSVLLKIIAACIVLQLLTHKRLAIECIAYFELFINNAACIFLYSFPK